MAESHSDSPRQTVSEGEITLSSTILKLIVPAYTLVLGFSSRNSLLMVRNCLLIFRRN